MKNLHDNAVLQEVIARLNTLRPDSQRQWGKMNVSQMLAHCSNALEVTLGERTTKQGLMGKIFGPLAKKSITSEKPFSRNLPTDPGFVIVDPVDFDKEKIRLIDKLTRVSQMDPLKTAAARHPFFGKMTADEWNRLNYKHLDHHLHQFGA